MVTGITERNKMKTELASIGYSLKFIDDWKPKMTFYRHKPSYNVEGEMTDDIGTSIPNLPGNPDYVARKARIGMLPYPPSDTCECKWCAVGNVNKDKVTDSGEKVDEMPESATCSECGKVERALTSQAAQMKIRVHLKTHSA